MIQNWVLGSLKVYLTILVCTLVRKLSNTRYVSSTHNTYIEGIYKN